MESILGGIPKIYFDSAPIIYYTEDRIPFADIIEKVMQYIIQNNIQIVTSVISVSECLTKPIRENDTKLITIYERFFEQTQNMNVIDISFPIARKSADLRAQYGLRTPDALHIATAIIAGCQAFLTNDIALKRINELKVWVLDDISNT